MTRELTQNAHNILPFANFMRERRVALCQRRLLLRDELRADAPHDSLGLVNAPVALVGLRCARGQRW